MAVLRALATAGLALSYDRLMAQVVAADLLREGDDLHALLGRAISQLVRERFVVAMAPANAPSTDRRGTFVALVPAALWQLQRADPALDAVVRDRLAGY